MNRLVAALARICRERPLTEKRLLCPSRRVSAQWTRQAAAAGFPLVNVRGTPLKALAYELAAPRFRRDKATLLPARGRLLLVEQVWRRWSKRRPRSYLGRLPASHGLAQALARSLLALRMASVREGDFSPEKFKAPEKGRDLAELLALYVHALRRGRWRDDADLFSAAVERILDEPNALGAATLYLIPGGLRADGLAQRLLDQLPADRVLPLPTDEPGKLEPGETVTDLARLRLLDEPGEAPPAAKDDSVRFFRALGETNEVKALFRTLLAEGIPLDQVEALHTDEAVYGPLIYETAMTLAAEAGQPIPVNFAEGLPARLSRPGRALAAWLRWHEEDLAQPALAAMLRSGLLRLGEHAPSPSRAADLAETLLSLEIFRERERYFDAFAHELKKPENEGRRRAQLADLWACLRPLLELLPEHPRPGDWLRGAEQFLLRFACGEDEFDNLSRDRLRQEIVDQLRWLEETEGLRDFVAFAWLSGLPDSVQALGQGPMPGTLHVANLRNGGHSGRPCTFILGLDEGRAATHIAQDPLLLDEERRQLSLEMATAAQQSEDAHKARLEFLARLRGRVWLSYSTLNLAAGSEQHASAFWTEAFRLTNDLLSLDQKALQEKLPTPAGFWPATEAEALGVAERWLLALAESPSPSAAEKALTRCFPDRAQGRRAAAARASTAFTEFDGHVPEAAPRHDLSHEQGPAASAASLQTLGACALRYYFSEVLRVNAPPDRHADPQRWFPSEAQGSLLHAVFQRYHAELKDAGLKPDRERDADRLRMLLHEEAARLRRRLPQPRPEVEAEELRLLEEALRVFLAEEAKLGTGVQPLYFEASIGMEARDGSSPLDAAEPVRVPLGGGLSLRLRGRIDRIDLVGTEGTRFAVWDYKTGRPDRYEGSEEAPFQGGRHLQPLIYLLLAEARLKAAHGPEAKVESAGYLFPGHGVMDRLRWPAETLAEGRRTLSLLAELVRGGAFLPTRDESACDFCGYARACSADVSAKAREKQNEEKNKPLEPLRQLQAEPQGPGSRSRRA